MTLRNPARLLLFLGALVLAWQWGGWDLVAICCATFLVGRAVAWFMAEW